jgi:hypothetical protein
MANKYVSVNSSGLLAEVEGLATSAGAGDSGKLIALDTAGRIDNTMMPVGIGADTATIASSENLAAGDVVNIWNDSGTPKVRKADASAANAGKRADGFVLSAVTSPANATVYFEGRITGLSGLTPGAIYFLSGGTAGAVTATAPTTSAHCVQKVGVAVSSTTLDFEPDSPIVRA